MGARDACGRWHWGLRWSSLWGRETCEGCAKMGGGAMRALPLGPSVELPYGATNRLRGVPKKAGGRMRAVALGPSAELPMGPRNV